MLLRLAYLAVTNGFAMLRLLSMSERAKDVEILALRHRITVLERQLHGQGHRVRFAPADRAFLAALFHRLPRDVLHRVRLVVRPDTVLRWHRDLIAARHGRSSRPKRVGRPSTVRSIRLLVLRLARENSTWGIPAHPRRAARPGHHRCRVHRVGDPQRRRHRPGTAAQQPDLGGVSAFPSRSHPGADFFETVTLTGRSMYVLAVIEHATRRCSTRSSPTPGSQWCSAASGCLA